MALDIDALTFGPAPRPRKKPRLQFGFGQNKKTLELDLDAISYGPAPTPAAIPIPAPVQVVDIDALTYGPAPVPAMTAPAQQYVSMARKFIDLESLTYGPAPVPVNAASGTQSKRAQEHLTNVRKRMGLPEPEESQAVSDEGPPKFQHIPFLDGLRALAILLVLTFHAGGPVSMFIAKRGGWAGVDAFFVISGFLITGILLRERERTSSISLKNFYIRRLLRLTPVYALFILVTLLINPLHCKSMTTAALIAAFYMCDLDIAFGWGKTFGSGLQIACVGCVWVVFYLFWPALMKRMHRYLPVIGVSIIGFCFAWRAYLIAHGANWMRLGGGFDTKFDAIMLGCLCAIALNTGRLRKWLEEHLRHGWITLALTVVTLFYVRGMGHPDGAVSLHDKLMYWDVRLPIFSVLIALLIVCMYVQPKSLTTKFFSLPPLVWLGKLSYSLYLWHMLAFQLVIESFNTNPFLRGDIEACNYIVAILFAAVSYYFVEKPFLSLKDRFNAKNEKIPPLDARIADAKERTVARVP